MQTSPSSGVPIQTDATVMQTQHAVAAISTHARSCRRGVGVVLDLRWQRATRSQAIYQVLELVGQTAGKGDPDGVAVPA
jgi:hypothetical protein